VIRNYLQIKIFSDNSLTFDLFCSPLQHAMYQRDRFDSQGKVFYSNVSHDIVAKENAILTEHTIGDIIYEDILFLFLRTSSFTKEMHK
jgi:hypothetical protein